MVSSSDSVGTFTSEVALRVGHTNSCSVFRVEDLNFDEGKPNKFAYLDAMDDWVFMDSGRRC